MTKDILWQKLFKAIEDSNYDEVMRLSDLIRLFGTDMVVSKELIRQVLKLLSEKLSLSFKDHEGRLCQVIYTPSELLPELRLEVKNAFLFALENLSREDILPLLEEPNVILALITKLNLQDEYREFINLMEKYPGRFSVFSLFSVHIRFLPLDNPSAL